jgi:hypothetical protein
MEQNVNTYLKTLLTKVEAYQLTPAEHKKVQRDKAGFITDKIMRKKFRRRVGDDARKSNQEKVALSIREDRPIHFTIPVGGYKHFWNPSHPGPDWAELIHLRWMTEYVQPILATHKPGVILEYISEDLILPRMNNYPDEALEAYAVDFGKMIKWYQQQVPQNLQLRYWRVGNKHDKQAIIDKIERLLPERTAAFQKLTPTAQEQETHRSRRSVYWDGKQDLTGLTAPEKYDRIVESRLIELAFYDVEMEPEFLGDYFNEDNHISLCFSFGLSPDNDEWGTLTIQSSSGSIVEPWIGRGILRQHGNTFRSTIVSQQQYKAAKNKLETIRVEPALLPLGNYRTIEVMK